VSIVKVFLCSRLSHIWGDMEFRVKNSDSLTLNEMSRKGNLKFCNDKNGLAKLCKTKHLH
jgi:hypothetical protein